MSQIPRWNNQYLIFPQLCKMMILKVVNAIVKYNFSTWDLAFGPRPRNVAFLFLYCPTFLWTNIRALLSRHVNSRIVVSATRGWFHKSWAQGANHRNSSIHFRPIPTPNFWEAFYWRISSGQGAKDRRRAQNSKWNQPQGTFCCLVLALVFYNSALRPQVSAKLGFFFFFFFNVGSP